MNQARAHYFHSSRWSGPAGSGAAAALWTVLASSTSSAPSALPVWLGYMAVAVSLQIAAFSIARSLTAADGLPKLSHLAHLAIGVGFGSTLWLDLDATRDPEFRWITLACLFAMSAGVVSGFSGFNRLGQLVSVPIWIGASTALLATGQVAAAAAAAIFAVITTRDMAEHGTRWTELLQLRHESAGLAEQHRWEANHDSLTGLLNRAGFIDRLNEPIEIGDRSVMFIDLDHFKEVNDRFGHGIGDGVLIEAARRISAVVRSDDIVGRLGGDEFCVMLGCDIDGLEAARLADRIVIELERPIPNPLTEDIFISASVGLARMRAEDSAERVLTQADHAMYQAKRTGRRRVVHFNEELEAELDERSGLEIALRQAIQQGGLSVAGQPIFNITTGEIRAVELLARWKLPGGESIPPAVFIPLAEEIGLIGDLTETMLRTAGMALQSWADDPRLKNARVSVNVSAVEFVRDHLVDRVAGAITEFGIEPGQLVLELTESFDVTNENLKLETFELMRAMGVAFAIDDFGAGYSSLDHLLSLPIDAVKLDLSLIDGLGVHPHRTRLLQHIHGLANVIGTSVIVEGVENQVQLDELHAIGATHGQGYFLCRPIPLDELPHHVRSIAPLRSAKEVR